MAQMQYTKQDPINHILTRPDMYVGSKMIEPMNEWVWTEESRLEKKSFMASPAIIRTFVEILSNAVDNAVRKPVKMTFIHVLLTPEQCEIVNDGQVIPVEVNEKENIYNHTLIFGHLLSGSNYNDREKRYTSGRNGLGAKLTNVLSKVFTVQAVDPIRQLKFTQTWTDNMKATSGPVIKKCTSSKGYTSVKWSWDFEWFGLSSVAGLIEYFSSFLVTTAMITGLKCTLNGQKLPNKLSHFPLLFTSGSVDTLRLDYENGIQTSTVLVSPSSELDILSFVNGMATKKGGKHVDSWIEAVCRPILDKLNGKDKVLTLKDIKPFFRFIIVVQIPNPEFEGQEKNELKAPNVTSEPITANQVNKIFKWSIGPQLLALKDKKEKKSMVAKLAMEKSTAVSVDGYDRANLSGGIKGRECTLIVCEGLSAKTFAVEGIGKGFMGRKGRDYFGIYPLRGKLLNTRNATAKTLQNNTVITNLIKILGLQYGKPNRPETLNYGKMCILTDADVDGIHIECLLLNFFHSLFPDLLRAGFVISMKTPILRIKSGMSTRFSFEHTASPDEKVTYIKGLGTIKASEVKDVFGIRMLDFISDEQTDSVFEMAFSKSESGKRKEWLELYFAQSEVCPVSNEANIHPVMISHHLSHELIKYFYDDCKRSLPSVLDGLKESQRKIVYAAKKKRLYTETKVAQFGAYVAEKTNYHHGEENLFKTIIKMAQSFPGSNNEPLLTEEGMFGTRLEGGEDAASPRYIYTKVSKNFDALFPSEDDILLSYRSDDGLLIEPYYYVPVVPLLLVNGCVGIGTGWMCSVPQFALKEVIQACRLWMRAQMSGLASDDDSLTKFLNTLTPSYKYFSGTISHTSSRKFITSGIVDESTFSTNRRLTVSELPIGLWNNKFHKLLDEMSNVRWTNNSTPTKVNYTLKVNTDFNSEDLTRLKKGLTSTLNLDNITVFDREERIVRLDLRGVFNMWGCERLSLNEKRKARLLHDYSQAIRESSYKVTFIQLVKDKVIDLTHEEESIIAAISDRITPDKECIAHLMDMPIRSLTEDRMKELKRRVNKLQDSFNIISSQSPFTMWELDVAKIIQ